MLKDPKPATRPGVSLTAHDFVKHERNHYWYIGVVMLLLVALFATVYIKDYWTAAVIIAVGIAVFRLIKVEPTKKEVRITANGVYWGDQFFPYHQLRAFWFTTVEGKTTFHLDRLNLNPEISFIVPESAQEEVSNHLFQALPWHHDTNEGIGERLGRWFKI